MTRSNKPAGSFTLRVVMATNLLGRGLRQGPVAMPLIQAGKAGRFQLVTAEALRAELGEVLGRPKFARYFTPETYPADMPVPMRPQMAGGIA